LCATEGDLWAAVYVGGDEEGWREAEGDGGKGAKRK